MSDEILDQELKQILWASMEHYKKDLSGDNEICYSWVINEYKNRFGVSFHQSKLHVLVKLGYLLPVDTSRGGKRRYYKILNMQQIATHLK